jgi:hypothetical protein
VGQACGLARATLKVRAHFRNALFVCPRRSIPAFEIRRDRRLEPDGPELVSREKPDLIAAVR